MHWHGWILQQGDFYVSNMSPSNLDAELSRLEAGELIVSFTVLDKNELVDILNDWQQIISPVENSLFDSAKGRKQFKRNLWSRGA
jgi:DNA mismatch repair ATPase MutS